MMMSYKKKSKPKKQPKVSGQAKELAWDFDFLYHIGNKVFGYAENGLPYEAKVLDVRVVNDIVPEYEIHYLGWKSSWDEWKDESLIMEHNKENAELAERLHREAKENKAKSKQAAKLAKVSPTKVDQPKDVGSVCLGSGSCNGVAANGKPMSKGQVAKKVREVEDEKAATALPAKSLTKTQSSNVIKKPLKRLSQAPTAKKEAMKAAKATRQSKQLQQEEEEVSSEDNPDFELEIPTKINMILAMDYHFVDGCQMLVDLPPKISVDQMLALYMQDRFPDEQDRATDRYKAAVLTVNKLKAMFNRYLGCRLLYKSERPQLQDVTRAMARQMMEDAVHDGTYQRPDPETISTAKKTPNGKVYKPCAPIPGIPKDSDDYIEPMWLKMAAEEVSSYYSPIHFLRFIVKLPDIVKATDLPETFCIKHFSENIMAFMLEQMDLLFPGDMHVNQTTIYARRLLSGSCW